MAEAFLGDKNGLVKKDRVVFDAGPARVPVGDLPRRRARPAGADAGGEPHVEVLKAEDGTVQQVTVRCPCGRQVTLQCDYLGRGDEDAKKSP
jgi:hypothetical protein